MPRLWPDVAASAGASFRLASAITGTLGLNARLGEEHAHDFGAFAGLGLGF